MGQVHKYECERPGTSLGRIFRASFSLVHTLLCHCVYLPEGVAQQMKKDLTERYFSSLCVYTPNLSCNAVEVVSPALCYHLFPVWVFYWWVTHRHIPLAVLIPPGLEYQTCMFLLEMLTNWIIMNHPQEFHCLSPDNCWWHASINSSKRCLNSFKSPVLPPSHLKYKWSAEL